jgi:predicted nucleotidyltransferase
MKKIAQNNYTSEYYQGAVPEYSVGGSVNYSQISSAFSRANETMEMVYQFAPDISRDISYIFDFSNQGAFGVYIPALVEQVKTNELKKRLEQRNYEVKYENNTLVAYPKNDSENDNEKIQQEIKSIWDQINAGKSEIIGVNMNKVKSTTESNMRDLVNSAERNGVHISQPQLLWDMLIMLELGATIVHEWEHSRGGDEAASQMREKAFVNANIEKIKQKYKMESGEDMPISSLSNSNKNWYKVAQSLNYLPQNYKNDPSGSDLSGRMGHPQQSHSNVAEWGLRNQMGVGDSVESKLGRQFMWPLANGLNQNHQIIEEQLRRQTADDYVADTSLIYEKLLSKDRDDSQAYKTIEQLMEEKRPQPIFLPIEKTASSNIIKQATLFGWYNNLEISDGSTIPGLGDRVMAWDDRDEDFSRDSSWIRQQPRYNPCYDLKGFYYRWIEPRFKPQLWTDMTQDYSNTHPAKRFAKIDSDDGFTKILQVLNLIKENILSGNIKSSRIVISEDLYPIVKNILSCDEILIKAFHFGEIKNEKIYSVWIADSNIESELLKNAEKAFRSNTYSDKYENIVNDLLGTSNIKAKAIEKIIQKAKEICKKINVDDLYLLGSYAREKSFLNKSPIIEELNFTTQSISKNLSIGQLLADELGVKAKISDVLTFYYKEIKVEFTIRNCKEHMKEIKSFNLNNDQLLIEVLKYDFTINMLAYNVVLDEIKDPCNVAIDDLNNKVIKTFFDSKKIIKNNPIIVIRALKLKLKYDFSIDENLEKNILIYGEKLLNSKYDNDALLFARESVRIEGRNEADILFDDYGIGFIKKIK